MQETGGTRPEGFLRRATLAKVLLPEVIEGFFARLLYFLFVYPLLVFVCLEVGFLVPSQLLLRLLEAASAPGWLALGPPAAVSILGLAWGLVAFVNGVRWVAARRPPEASGDPEWGIGPMIRTAKEYWREMRDFARQPPPPPDEER